MCRSKWVSECVSAWVSKKDSLVPSILTTYNICFDFFGKFNSLNPVKRHETPVQSSLSSILAVVCCLICRICALVSGGESDRSAWVTSSFMIFSLSSLKVSEWSLFSLATSRCKLVTRRSQCLYSAINSSFSSNKCLFSLFNSWFCSCNRWISCFLASLQLLSEWVS